MHPRLLISLLTLVVPSLVALAAPEGVPVRKPAFDDEGRTLFPTRTKRMHTLVVPLQFSGTKFSGILYGARLNDMLNLKGYSESGAIGSAADYFDDCSSGAFRPTFDVAGIVSLPQTASYYAGTTGRQRVDEAIKYALDELEKTTDFARYDFDNDGVVDTITFVFAGHSDEEGEGGIPQFYGSLLSQNVSYNDKLIGDYSFISEFQPSTSLRPVRQGIGPFCRGLARALGLPEMAPPAGSVATNTPGQWSLMDSGYRNGNAWLPPMMSAYEQWMLRWLEFDEPAVDADGNWLVNQKFLLPAVGTPGRKALRIYSTPLNGGEKSEFFVFETRGTSRWDAALPEQGGVLVWRVNYDSRQWSLDYVNAYGQSRLVPLVSNPEENMYLWPGRRGYGWYISGVDAWLAPLSVATAFNPGFADVRYNTDTETASLVFNSDAVRPEITAAVLTSERIDFFDNDIRLSWEDAGPDCFYLLTVRRPDDMSKYLYLNDIQGYFTSGTTFDIRGISPDDWKLVWDASVTVVSGLPSLIDAEPFRFIPAESRLAAAVEDIEGDHCAAVRVENDRIIAPEGTRVFTPDGREVSTAAPGRGIRLIILPTPATGSAPSGRGSAPFKILIP